MARLWESLMEVPGYFEASPWFPNPLICLRDMVITGSKETIERLPWNGIGVWLAETWGWISQCKYYDPAAFLLPVGICIILTLLRIFLNWSLFKRIPKWCKFSAESEDKFPESIWKTLYYTCTWIWSVYVMVSSKRNAFFDLRSHWDSWSADAVLEPSLYWLYMTQMGFYLHCSYASIYIETIRKDFVVLMIHHILTLGLLLFSYLVRFHVIGLVLLSILDVGDVLLEGSKTVVYFKDRGDGKNPVVEFLSNICFAIFTIQFILCRLYWYPTKVIYSAMYTSVHTFPGGPYYLLFIPMLWGLYAMQVYWFKFIVRLLFKIFVLGHGVEDVREEEEEGEQENGEMVESNGKKVEKNGKAPKIKENSAKKED